MLVAALTLRERLVRHVTEEVLQEPVLSLLRRARIRLERQDLATDKAGEQLRERRAVEAGQRSESSRCERLSEDGGVLHEPPLVGRETVQSRRDECMQRLRDLERLDLADDFVRGAFLDEQPS